MTPTESYDALMERIVSWSVEQVVGKGEIPRTKAEQEAVRRRVTATMAQAQIFHIKPDLHPKQSLFLRVKAPIVLACTGNKWGKTFAGLLIGLVPSLHCVPWASRAEQDEAYEIFSKVALKYEPPILVTLCGPDFVKWLPLNIIPRLKKLIPWAALITRHSRVQGQIIDGFEFWNGSSWQILSYAGEPERFEGWSSHIVLWDEPMLRENFVAASRGCVEFGARHIMTFTPENLRDAFCYDDLYDRGFRLNEEKDLEEASSGRHRIVVVEGSIYENPHISDYDKKTQIDFWTEEERESRVWGRFRSFHGRVYKNYDESRHVRSLDSFCNEEQFRKWPKGISLDPAGRKAFMLGYFILNPSNDILFFDEWPEEEFYTFSRNKPSMGPASYVDLFRRIEQGHNRLGRPYDHVTWRIMDAIFGKQPQGLAGQTLQFQMAELGMYFDADINMDVDTRVLMVTQRLEDDRLFFTDHCMNLRQSMMRWIWDDHRREDRANPKGTTKQGYKDGADVVGFACMKDPQWFDTEPPPSIGKEEGSMFL